MAIANWKLPVSGSWTTAGNWSTGTIPTLADDAVIGQAGSYTVSIIGVAAAAHSIAVSDPGARLAIDAVGPGGSIVTVSETLSNAGPLRLGGVGLNQATIVTVAALDNTATGSINLIGGTAAPSLDVTGNLGNAHNRIYVDRYGSGGSTLTVGGTLTNSGTLVIGNSAISHASTVTTANLSSTGSVLLHGGVTMQASLIVGAAAPTTLTGSYYLSGDALLEFASGGIATIANGVQMRLVGAGARVADAAAPGSNSALQGLTENDGILNLMDGVPLIDGAATYSNTGTTLVDRYGTGGSTLALGALSNSGKVYIGSSAITHVAEMSATSVDNAAGGAIGLVSGGASAELDDSGDFNNAGTTGVDQTGLGDSTLTISGTLENSNRFIIGNAGTSQATTVSTAAVNNTADGQFTMVSGTGAAKLEDSGDFGNTGTTRIDPSGNGASDVTIGGTLSNFGFFATFQIGSNETTSQTVVTAAAVGNSGTMPVLNSDLTVTGDFTNSAGGSSGGGDVEIDSNNSDTGGSTVTIGGVLNNINHSEIAIGNKQISRPTTVTAAQLVNGEIAGITVTGSTTTQASLIVGAAAPATLIGEYRLEGNALIQFASGAITSIGDGEFTELHIVGADSHLANASAPDSNSALATLATVETNAEFNLESGATDAIAGDFTNKGTVFLTGQGTMLSVAGAVSNLGDLFVTSDSVLALGSSFTTPGGTTGLLELDGGEIRGGTLHGPGNMESLNGGTLDGTTIAADAGFAVHGPLTVDNVTVAGLLTGDGVSTTSLVFGVPGTDEMTNTSGFPAITLANGGANQLTLTDANFAHIANRTIAVNDGDSGNTIDAAAALAADTVIVHAGAGADQVTGGPGNNVYDFNNSAGATLAITNAFAGGTAAHGELDFPAGLTDQNLWFVESGNNLVAEVIGTPEAATVNGWFGSNPSAQLAEISAGSLKLDTQVAQLVQAMATYSASHPGFDPTASGTVMPNDPALQSALAASWHA